MVTAMGEKYTRRPQDPFLLHTAEGKYEPSVCKVGRLVRHWVKHAGSYNIPQGYWNHCLQSPARAGPIHIVAQAVKQHGIHARGPFHWEIDGDCMTSGRNTEWQKPCSARSPTGSGSS